MKRSVGKYILICTISLTLAFIYIQSMLPREVSGEESGAVAGFLAGILPEGAWLTEFLVKNIRKIAHFVEYAALGTEIALYVNLYMQKRRDNLLVALPFGLLAGFLDETVQIFSGRGPSVTDVWLDFSGYTSLFLLTTLAFCIARKLKTKGKRNGKDNRR